MSVNYKLKANVTLQHDLKIEKRKEKEKNHIPREELNSKYSSSQNASCAVCMVQGKKNPLQLLSSVY